MYSGVRHLVLFIVVLLLPRRLFFVGVGHPVVCSIHVLHTGEGIMKQLFRVFVFAGACAFASSALSAQTNVTPNLGTQVGSFYTDRYNPATWGLINSYQGRNDVLQIGINSSTDASNRGGQSPSFYNTQGKKLDVNTAGSWLFQSDLFVQSSWDSSQSGLIRTDMWATQCNGPCIPNSEANVTDYPIIGFTNDGSGARFRGWTNSGWVDFGSPVNLGAWNTLTMSFDATDNTFSYGVNGTNQYSFSGSGTSTEVGNVMYQAYNFNNSALGIQNNPAYDVRWSNTPTSTVPEPSTYVLMAAGLAGLGFVARKRRTTMLA